MAIGSSVQRAGTATHTFDLHGLYILLSEQNTPDTWHWGLYLHCGPNGWVYHITRVADGWFFDKHLSTNIIYSLSMVAALKIAVIEHPETIEALGDRLTQVPLMETTRFRPLTCRTWLLRAVNDLDNEGFISLKVGTTVENLETEAEGKAVRAARNRIRTVDNSSLSLA
ncbi:hypothetical protein V501_05475 [Pseudogymnoascus sp. VKM F-4519 (FW-2642)]|nr:hypothetical protein V501_05475 [Pseudogymnoascus sp. VKM F-4519 (FW-2642)]